MWGTGQYPKVENVAICGESEPMLHSLTTSDWSHSRIHIQVAGSFRLSWGMKLAGDRGWCSKWIQGREGKAWGQKGDLGLAGPAQLSHSCFHPLALWHRPSLTPARYAASASPGGEATRPAWAGPGCLKPWAGAGWIGFPEAIYIYKGCREPWGQPLPEGATLWGPASNVLHSCPEAGSPFIALGQGS